MSGGGRSSENHVSRSASTQGGETDEFDMDDPPGTPVSAFQSRVPQRDLMAMFASTPISSSSSQLSRIPEEQEILDIRNVSNDSQSSMCSKFYRHTLNEECT